MENNNQNDIFELLAPAGSYDTFKAVINAGADAVYVGGDLFGARAYANNFTTDELISAINYAHLRGRKVYLTVNTLLKNDEIKNKLIEYIKPFYLNGLDAVLVQDFGTLRVLHDTFPDLPLHTSTQMTVTSSYGVRFLQKYGVTRVVMAREVSLDEMKHLHEETGMEIEAFVHGALCYSYSGQCLFSSMIGGRSGNRGRCAQPCRLPYHVFDSQMSKISTDDYILSLKDMCGIESLKELHEAGVYSLKIEGRMKQTSYAAGIVSYYRKYIDKYIAEHNNDVSKNDRQAISNLGNRCGFTNDYYFKHNSADMVTYKKPNYATADEKLHQSVLDRYTSDNKLPITGHAYFYKNAPAVLNLFYNDHCITVEGNVVEEAKNSPVTYEQIKSRLSKIKDTDFEFSSLVIEIEDNVFVPNGELNRLKRAAVDQLYDELLSDYKRDESSIAMLDYKITGSEQSNLNNTSLRVSIEDRNLLDLCVSKDYVDKIYIDYDAYNRNSFAEDLSKDIDFVKLNNKDIYLTMPYIFRKDTASFFEQPDVLDILTKLDGLVIKNYEELQFIKENLNKYLNEIDVIIDYNMYTYNDYAKYSFELEGILHDTVPVELNSKEIANRNNSGSEMIIYGHYVLMTSAGCVHKNTKGCDKCKQTLYLKDRYNKLFAVKNKCNECYNTIYNSVPTMLFSNIDKIKSYGINDFRICFTTENISLADKVLELYNNFDKENVDFEYTNGHFKRGVE